MSRGALEFCSRRSREAIEALLDTLTADDMRTVYVCIVEQLCFDQCSELVTLSAAKARELRAIRDQVRAVAPPQRDDAGEAGRESHGD